MGRGCTTSSIGLHTYEQAPRYLTLTVTGQPKISINIISSGSVMNQVNVDNKVVMLSGGAGGLGRSLADLVLTRGGHVYVCDVAQDYVTSVVETMADKHKDGKVAGCELDVRSEEAWNAAWKVLATMNIQFCYTIAYFRNVLIHLVSQIYWSTLLELKANKIGRRCMTSI